MIPRDYITEWRSEAPWIRNDQVEQDLVISRALADTSPLLSAGYTWNPEAEAPLVSSRLIEHLPGDPWKGAA